MVRLGAFVTRIHETHGTPVEALRDELLAAARKTAADVLGAEPRIEVVWSDGHETIDVRQVVTAVDRVTRPYRELPVAELRSLGADFDGMSAGEELELSVLFHEEDAATARALDAQFGGLLALSCFQRSLHAPLEEAWIAVLHRHLAPRTWPDGTAASLFQRGGWLAGTRAEREGVTLSIVKGTWTERPVTPDDASIHVGFSLRIERWGRSLDLPMERVWTLGEVREWAALPVAESRRAAVERELAAAAQRLSGETSVDRLEGGAFVERILAAILGSRGGG